MIRRRLSAKMARNPLVDLVLDYDRVLEKKWGLKDDRYNVMVFDKEGKLFFLKEGVCDLNVAAERLRVALPVVERTFADGVLKGYWKVANGKLLIKSHRHQSTGCDHVPPRPSAARDRLESGLGVRLRDDVA